jgi:hypothetical protein
MRESPTSNGMTTAIVQQAARAQPERIQEVINIATPQ